MSNFKRWLNLVYDRYDALGAVSVKSPSKFSLGTLPKMGQIRHMCHKKLGKHNEFR